MRKILVLVALCAVVTGRAGRSYSPGRAGRSGGGRADKRSDDDGEQHHAGEGVLTHALRHEVDWVVVVCGAYFHPDIAVLARRAGLRLPDEPDLTVW